MESRASRITRIDELRVSEIEARIENVVRAKAPEIADRWFWGSAGGGRGGGARGADGRTLYAYWQTNLDVHEKLVPDMRALRDEIESLEGVAEVRVRDFEPETGYSGAPVVGEQWELHLDVDVVGPSPGGAH
jgi:hypothetical protein